MTDITYDEKLLKDIIQYAEGKGINVCTERGDTLTSSCLWDKVKKKASIQLKIHPSEDSMLHISILAHELGHALEMVDGKLTSSVNHILDEFKAQKRLTTKEHNVIIKVEEEAWQRGLTVLMSQGGLFRHFVASTLCRTKAVGTYHMAIKTRRLIDNYTTFKRKYV